jgi:hypothetical protein
MSDKTGFFLSLLGLFIVVATASGGQTQGSDFDRVEPAFWWVGMKNTELQILVINKINSYQQDSGVQRE